MIARQLVALWAVIPAFIPGLAGADDFRARDLVGLLPIAFGDDTPAQTPPDPACRIKGNINHKGERIYHPPGDPDYNHTRIDLSRGERWFCSEAEARAAGWRATRKRY